MIDAGDGNSLIVAGSGFDTLYGGAGPDIFSFNSISHAASRFETEWLSARREGAGIY